MNDYNELRIFRGVAVALLLSARDDYRKLVKLAVDAGVTEPIPLPPADAGWRIYDKAADVLIVYILKAKPELREQIRAIYPGWVELNER